MNGRDERTTPEGRLARLGFIDPGRAAQLLNGPAVAGLADEPDMLNELARSPDPDLALTGLTRLADAVRGQEGLWDALRADGTLRERLFTVLGYSIALSDHLARHPRDWRVLAEHEGVASDGGAPESAQADAAVGEAGNPAGRELLQAVGADPDSAAPVAGKSDTQAMDALRATYYRCLLWLAARDLTGAIEVSDVAARLADLAGAALDAALAVARAELPDDAAPCRLAVIGMGKCGGLELNYASDVDVVFVAAPPPGPDGAACSGAVEAALRTASQLAAGMIRCCTETTSEGTLWPVDAGLRPEGRNGPLVRTLASHVAYYEQWAKTWEFQALLKARPVAGDRELGQAYIDALAPMVWRAAEREHFVTDVQAMRRRVEEQVPRQESQRQLKLGAGGLRDVEFAVQLLQLVHGRSDEELHSPNTLAALEALSAGGYVGRGDASSLASAYRFLRSLEHLVQLRRLRRTHVLPSATEELRRIGRVFGFRGNPVDELLDTWRRHSREVRRLHEKLFYRPLLLAVARLPGDEARLTTGAARQRLKALGYADPSGSLGHIEALTSGVSRRAAIQRTLLPVMLGWFADAADPDGGLLGFRRVSEALGGTPWYLRLLRDEGAAAERMAHLLASSRYVTDLLLRAPDAVAMLGDDREIAPRSAEALETEMAAAVRRHRDISHAAGTLRALRRHELLRVAVADLLGMLTVEQAGQALTDVAVATLRAALDLSWRAAEEEAGSTSAVAGLAVIGMGRLGGGEMSYSSDADALFVYAPEHGREWDAGRGAHAIASQLRQLLEHPGPDPPLPIDASLRPEGKDGPLVRSLDSYAAYYSRWASTWERQALLRAEPVAGDAELGERFRELVDPVRYPQGGIDNAGLREIRRLKARMEAERLPRGADPTTHVKLGRGGLSDVEWVVQLVQLRHAAATPSLQVRGTVPALEAAVQESLLDAADADALAEAWRSATRLRNATMLVRNRPSDVVPSGVRERAAVARVLGYSQDRTGELLEDYRRVTRRARTVVEGEFFG